MVRTVNIVIDVLLPFISNKELIEGLAISEVPEFKDKFHRIKWIVKYKNTDVKLGGDRYLYLREQWEKHLKRNQIPKLPLIGIPGGYLGIQAFYLILENFWRNLVKHNVSKVRKRIGLRNGCIKIYIKIRDKPDTPFWELILWADIETEKETSKKINKILETGIIDDEGKLIPEGWGTKEMLIAAAYLRGAPIMRVQSPENKQILRCTMHQGKYLCYSFDVLKPMELFLLTDKQVESSIRKTLTTKGVYIAHSITKDFIVPTEYLVVDPGYQKSEPLDSLRPIKFFKKEVDVKSLVNDDKLLSLLIQLESDFAKRLFPTNVSKVYLIIRSGGSRDMVLGCFSSDPLYVEAIPDLSAEQIQSKAQDGFVIVFDRHGGLNRNNALQNLQTQSRERIFWEPYGGGTQTAFMLQHVPENEKRKILLAWQIVTSALLKVAILDERIQQILDKPDLYWKYGEGPKIAPLDCLRMMRIFIPHMSNCNNHPNADKLDLENPKEKDIKNWIERICPHILSIHAGILDKMGMKKPKDVVKWVSETMKLLDKNVKCIIIHSGRGIPVNVPSLKVPYVGYTPIEHYTASRDLKSKYALVQELLAARGVKR